MPLPDERPRASVANLIGRFEKAKSPASGSERGSSPSNSPLLRPLAVKSNSPAFLGLGSTMGSPPKDRSPLLGNGWRAKSSLEPSPAEISNTVPMTTINPAQATPPKEKEKAVEEPETPPEDLILPVSVAPTVEPDVTPPPAPTPANDPVATSTAKEATPETITLNSPLSTAEPNTTKPSTRAANTPRAANTSPSRPVRQGTTTSRAAPPTASASSLSQSVSRGAKPSSAFAKPRSSSIGASGSTQLLAKARSTPHLKKDAKEGAALLTNAKSPPLPPASALRPQHTGTSIASAPRRYAPPPPPPPQNEAPRRAKTPSMRAKTPTTTTSPRQKVQASGSSSALYAPTASSLARMKAAADAKADGSSSSASLKPALPISSSSRLMAPTAASLARMGANKAGTSPLPPSTSIVPKSSASASGNRRVLITAAKAVPGRSKGVTGVPSKASLQIRKPCNDSTPASSPAPTHPDSEDDQHANMQLGQEPIPGVPAETKASKADHNEAHKPVGAPVEVPQLDVVPPTPYVEAFADDEADTATPSPSADANSTPNGADAEYFGDGVHITSQDQADVEHKDQLEQIVAMLEGATIPPRPELEAKSQIPPPTKAEALHMEKEEEKGGYEDDVEEDIPDIPDHEF
ncbi:hypothetical protein FRB94_009266 [Tulasnella sp. JGI-2019a]|nr:hypothetical protein FRB94_009266 [Tulasnella sp. JGI-2019a]